MSRASPARTRWIRLVYPVFILMVITTITACKDDSPTAPSGTIVGSGSLVQQSRTVSGFTGVTFSMVGVLEITQGSSEALVVEAEDNLLQHFRTVVQGGVLEISIAPGVSLQPTRTIRFRLTVVTLENITLTGVGDIEAGRLEVDELGLTLSGVGNFTISELDADDIDVTISGVGNMSVAGAVDTQRIALSGAGNYDGTNLQSSEVRVEISGSGSATVRVSGLLVATISGSGSVRYIGNPTVVATVTGSGSVVQIGDG